jgi:hypothetical protein
LDSSYQDLPNGIGGVIIRASVCFQDHFFLSLSSLLLVICGERGERKKVKERNLEGTPKL